MYKISKRMEVAGAHKLKLDYDSPCQNLHGHNWIITCYFASQKLDNNGMIVDFTQVKKLIHGKLDHQLINEVAPFMNPTAENISRWCCEQLSNCYKVTVQESEGNIASYVNEDMINNYGMRLLV